MIRKLLVTMIAFALGALLAACGSSKAPGIVLAPQAGLTAEPSTTTTPTTSTGTTSTATTTTAVTTPKPPSPLSKEPVVTVPKTPAPTKLVTKDLITGTGATANTGSSVTVNYVGVLYKGGKQFDASWNRKQTFPFTLGQGAVIKGWDQGIVGMRVGGRRELIIPASLAYGATGSPPTIPPNSALIFVVDLLAAS